MKRSRWRDALPRQKLTTCLTSVSSAMNLRYGYLCIPSVSPTMHLSSGAYLAADISEAISQDGHHPFYAAFDETGCLSLRLKVSSNGDIAFMNGRKSFPTDSWRRMLVTQPPLTRVEVSFKCRPKRLRREEEYTQTQGIRFEHLFNDLATFMTVNRWQTGVVSLSKPGQIPMQCRCR